MTLTYSNPRMTATVENWPSGRHRTTAVFTVQQTPSRGERGTRYTIDPKTGKPCAAKTLTYARKVRIVDGSDGKTYLAELTAYGFVTIMRSAQFGIQEEVIHEREPRHAEIMKLFEKQS